MSAARGAPTLTDVARRAGVHPATVSRALSRPSMVAPATRAAVLDAVQAVGFIPNRSARQLVSGRAGAIGVVVPDITNPYFATILQAIQTAAGGHDGAATATGDELSVLIADTGADAAAEARVLATLGRQVDGLVVLTPVTDLAAAPVPVVQVNRRSRRASSVVVDQAAIVEVALAHVVELGHRHIAVLTGPAGYWSTQQRARALTRADRAPELRIDPIGPVPGTFDGGHAALRAVHATRATAVLAFNDVQAAGLLVAAADLGIAVPDELSVVGSDGLQLAAMTGPPLTTVAAPLGEIGQHALARLTALLAGPAGATNTGTSAGTTVSPRTAGSSGASVPTGTPSPAGAADPTRTVASPDTVVSTTANGSILQPHLVVRASSAPPVRP